MQLCQVGQRVVTIHGNEPIVKGLDVTILDAVAVGNPHQCPEKSAGMNKKVWEMESSFRSCFAVSRKWWWEHYLDEMKDFPMEKTWEFFFSLCGNGQQRRNAQHWERRESAGVSVGATSGRRLSSSDREHRWRTSPWVWEVMGREQACPRGEGRQMEQRKGATSAILLCFQSVSPEGILGQGKQETNRWSEVCWVKLIYICLMIQVWILGPQRKTRVD